MIMRFLIFIFLLNTVYSGVKVEFENVKDKHSYSFAVQTQQGRSTCRLEVRRLFSVVHKTKHFGDGFYLVLLKGVDSEPEIISHIGNAIQPVLKVNGNDLYLYYISGANSYGKEYWRIKGTKLTKVYSKGVDWKEYYNMYNSKSD